jgi:hypothetical protein
VQRAINRLESTGFIGRENRRSKGIIASNSYDLSPLVSLLGEVAKAYPNDFPRKLDKAAASKIGAHLDEIAKANKKAELET